MKLQLPALINSRSRRRSSSRRPPDVGPYVVVVDTVKLDRRAVELQNCAVDRDLTEADTLGVALDRLPASDEGEFQVVERRSLGRPERGLRTANSASLTPSVPIGMVNFEAGCAGPRAG